MTDIQTLVRKAARRMECVAFLCKAHVVALFAAGVVLLLMIADRLGAQAFVPWTWVGPVLAAMVAVIAAALWLRSRSSEIEHAVAVDDKLELREKLSTAMFVSKRNDPFAQAAIADALTAARDPRNREQIRRRFPITAPKGWWMSPLVVFLAIMIGQLQPLNLFASDEPAEAELVKAEQESASAINAIIEQIKQRPELATEMTDILGDLTDEGIDPIGPRTPEEAKRTALKKVTELNNKLNELMNGERGETMKALEKKFKELKTPNTGPAKELADALKAGDFEAAKKALSDMADQAKKGDMTEEQKEELAEALKNIAEQLEKLAEQQKQLEQALKDAGLDPQLAQNPEALKQAIENSKNLNQQQKQQLQQMAKAQQQANQMCQGLGQACQGMGQAMAAGKMGKMGQGSDQAMQQLDAMEQLQQMLMQAQAMAGQCQGQCQGLGQGLMMQQAMQQWKRGMGMGNWGAGQGGKAPIAPTPSGFKVEKAQIKTTGEGGIIARTLVDGPLEKGESKQSVAAAVLEEVAGYDEALSEDELPRKYTEAMMHYFGELEKQVKKIQSQSDVAGASDKKTGESAGPEGG